jgi:hypothetical protein
MTSFCHAQNSFTLGAKIGYGTSAFPMNAKLETNGVTEIVKSGATLSTGIIGRYSIGDRIGIESGVWLNHYSFYNKDKFRTRDAIWKSAAEFEVANYQMPIILNYKVKMQRHPFRYFVVGAGTTLDWFLVYWSTGLTRSILPGNFKNIVGSLKTGRERMKGNQLEIGLEIQYALKQFELDNHDYSYPKQQRVTSKTNMVSLSIAYFFLKKQRTNEAL